MERCIFNVYKYSILESQSMQPYAESDEVGSLAAQNICIKNQHIKINVVVTQVILDFCNMELFQGGKCRE